MTPSVGDDAPSEQTTHDGLTRDGLILYGGWSYNDRCPFCNLARCEFGPVPIHIAKCEAGSRHIELPAVTETDRLIADVAKVLGDQADYGDAPWANPAADQLAVLLDAVLVDLIDGHTMPRTLEALAALRKALT